MTRTMLIKIILTLTLSSVFAQNCDYTYDDTLYEKTIVFNTTGLPTNLVVNPRTKALYFTLLDVESLRNEHEQTKMDQYVYVNEEIKKIDNINGQAAAVGDDGEVYVATDDGIYKLNSSDQAEYYSMRDEDIVQLSKPKNTDYLYTVLFPENYVYKFNLKTHTRVRVHDIPCAFILAVDNNENVFYECNSKYVKVLLKDYHEPFEFAALPKDSGRAITIDDNNRAILATNDGLYHLKSDNIVPAKLMSLDFIPSGVAFDKDDIYIASNEVIFKFSNAFCKNTNDVVNIA